MKFLNALKEVLISPRFLSLYWGTGITFAVAFLALVSEAIPNLGLPEMAVTIIVLALSQISKAISNLRRGRDMGFRPKDECLS